MKPKVGPLEPGGFRRPVVLSEARRRRFYSFLVILRDILLEPLLKILVFLANKYQLGRQLSRNKGRVKAKDLITGRFLGQGCSGIFYETVWLASLESKARLARKDFPGVKGDVFESEVIPLFELHDHPNVVKTLCWTVDNRSCSLVMEYMKDDLSSVMRRKKEALRKIEHNQPVAGTSSAPFELLEAMNIALQIATGMEYLHDNGIIHGDLKPNNVLIDWKEGQMLVKVTDFGLIETKRRTTLISQRAVCFRMIEWSAPEVFEAYFVSMGEDLDYVWTTSPKGHSDESASNASDLDEKTMMKLADSYSFALTCAYILGGQRWSTKLSPNELRETISSRILSPCSRPDLPFECPEKLASLISKCWDPDPKCRPTFSIICNELQEIIKEQGKQEKEGEMRKIFQYMLQEQRELEVQRQQETLRNVRYTLQEFVKEKLQEALRDLQDSKQDVKVVQDFTADYSSLKPIKLETLNSPIPKAFDVDSSKMVYPDLDPDALLRKGKALLSANIEPKESISSKFTPTEERETFKAINIQIPVESRPVDVGPSDHVRPDDGKVFLDPRDGPATSGAMDDQNQLEPWRSRKRLRSQYSSSTMDDEYDVFLNHRGPGVKAGFVAHLEDALQSAGLNPFLDQESIRMGHLAFRSNDNALEKARVHVAVVSKGYAESKWCLCELVTILMSQKPVVPVFYDVEPSDLCKVERGPFAAAFEKHKSKETPEQVEEWRNALRKLADVTGFCLSDYRDEEELKWRVVDAILSLVPPMEALQVGCHLVGLKDQLDICINKLERMSSATSVLSLCGMGGIGKTTLAKEIYNHFVGHEKFQAMSFLEIDRNLPSSMEVGPSLIRRLQKQLLWDLLSITNMFQLKSYKYWFQQISYGGPVLVVLDDIYDKSQFDELILDSSLLAPGSCIIVTSRDQHLLKLIAGESSFYLYVVPPLGCDDSQKLFNMHAFGNKEAPKAFKALANDVSKACGGLPLALKVVGSSLFGKSSDEDRESIWLDAIETLRGSYNVMSVLQWSYDNLSKPEKLMFVDIACVFYGWKKEEALEIWKSCQKCSSCCGSMMPHTSLGHLIDKSLVVLEYSSEGDILAMHGLLRDMGQSIGLCEGSHLWEDKTSNVVKDKTQKSTSKVKALNLLNSQKLQFEAKDFTNVAFDVSNLGSILKGLFWLLSSMRPKPSILDFSNFMMSEPSILDFSNLMTLDFSQSTKLADVWARSEPALEGLPNLLRLDLTRCTSLTTLPNSIGRLCRLQELYLRDCGKLQKLPSSLGMLTDLEVLDLSRCSSLETLPAIGQFKALENLILTVCTDELITLLDIAGTLRNLNKLAQFHFFDCNFITNLPETIGLLTNLEHLQVYGCEKLQKLPYSIGQLKVLKTLDVIKCSSLQALPESLGALKSLQSLEIVECTSITELPDTIGLLPSLSLLRIECCVELQSLPASVWQLNVLQVLLVIDCGTLEDLGLMRVLQGLRIWGCTSITELPGSSLIVMDSNFLETVWYYDLIEGWYELVPRDLEELRVLEENDCGFLRLVQDTRTGRLLLQRVQSAPCRGNIFTSESDDLKQLSRRLTPYLTS